MTLDTEPLGQNEAAPNAGHEPNNQAGQTNPNVPIRPSVPSSPPPKTHCEVTCKTEKDFWDKFKNGAEIFGIFLLLVYTLYTIKMYCANKKAADAAASAAETAANTFKDGQTSFRDDHRAWLAVTLFNVERYNPRNRKIPFQIRLNLHNSGKTPVVNMHAGVRFAFANRVVDALPAAYYEAIEKELRETKGRAYVAPDGNMNVFGDDSKDGAVRGKYPTIVAKEEFVYLYGIVDYFDVYKRPHTTKVCLYMLNASTKQLALCQEGNEMD